MIPRFIAFLAADGPGLGALVGDTRQRAQQAWGLASAFKDQSRLVLADASTPVLPLANGNGVVIGTLFDRNRPQAPVAPGDDLLGDVVAASGGASLLSKGFGGYVAIIREPGAGRTHVLRDPSGVMPCHHLDRPRGAVVFSDVEPVVDLGLIEPRLDPAFVAHHLAFRHLRSARTGLDGLFELVAGNRRTYGPGDVEETCLWSPWTFADRHAQRTDRKAAVDLLRDGVDLCVSAWASTAQTILLELSGGLDSSIVAAALKPCAERVTCVTFHAPNAGGDERRYASQAAAALGAPLVAVPLLVEAIDVTRPPAALQPRPGLGALQQAVDAALLAAGERLAPDAFFAGGGGDNVFCYLATAAPAVDAALTSGLGAGLRQALADLSVMYEEPQARVAWLALKKLLRGPAPAWRRDVRFLDPDAAPHDPDPHPWLGRPKGALPGKVEHVASLMTIQTAPDGKARSALAPVRHPLLAQPLVELCLSLPTWMWIGGGRNRSLAREAFEGRLPPDILERRTKGELVTYSGQIYERNRRRLADHVLGGWLSQAGLIDRRAIETYLQSPAPPKEPHFFRLLEMAGVEAWARAWSARSGA